MPRRRIHGTSSAGHSGAGRGRPPATARAARLGCRARPPRGGWCPGTAILGVRARSAKSSAARPGPSRRGPSAAAGAAGGRHGPPPRIADRPHPRVCTRALIRQLAGPARSVSSHDTTFAHGLQWLTSGPVSVRVGPRIRHSNTTIRQPERRAGAGDGFVAATVLARIFCRIPRAAAKPYNRSI